MLKENHFRIYKKEKKIYKILKILFISYKVNKKIKEDIESKHNLIGKIVIVHKIKNINNKNKLIFLWYHK